jgi:hypothetical protein
MDSAGIIPEEDLQDKPETSLATQAPAPISEEGEERLTVFQDFLEGLDLGEEDSEENSEDEDSEENDEEEQED